ncbi:hypothetical protein EJ03DRAFT_211078 [Teratosphaeria nubilosa]|uniref:Uncharacterized protein n=1 Tax=Teratosphaeria nubilosa TaxID=161662 RepID=A0A6G1KZ28_9PEZI|nr:hypothetical protein EJ03DRAFT_211078 [Teratosphaeria nubilosa]
MFASKTLAASLLLSLALAADHVPVTIENLNADFNVNCGKTTVKGTDIYNAIAWGMSLNDDEQTYTSTDGNAYPSYYGNSEGFQWESSECGNRPNDARQHMPVIQGGYFGETTLDAGKYRAVYWYNYESDSEGHPKGYYCGTIYHAGSDNSFSGCDVKKG